MRDDNVFFFGMLLFIFLVAGGVIFFGEMKHQQRSIEAKEEGCSYIGSARDLVGVRFYLCDGNVEMRYKRD